MTFLKLRLYGQVVESGAVFKMLFFHPIISFSILICFFFGDILAPHRFRLAQGSYSSGKAWKSRGNLKFILSGHPELFRFCVSSICYPL